MDTLITVFLHITAIAVDSAIIVIFIKLWLLIVIYGLMFLAFAVIGAAVCMGVDVVFLDTAIHDQALHAVGMLCIAASAVGAGVMTIKVWT